MIRYEYTRANGELFIITENGFEVSVLNGEGQLTHMAKSMPMPADVIASTVVELALAGWTMEAPTDHDEPTEDELDRMRQNAHDARTWGHS